MDATPKGKSGRGGRRAGAGRKRDPNKMPKAPPKQRGGSGRGGWRPGAGRKVGSKTRSTASRSFPGQIEMFPDARVWEAAASEAGESQPDRPG